MEVILLVPLSLRGFNLINQIPLIPQEKDKG